MLRKILRVLFVVALIIGAIWVYMRLVVEPCVRDISRFKLKARDLSAQLAGLESAGMLPELSAREKKMLENSRLRLRARLTKFRHLPASWKQLAGQIVRHAARKGIKVRVLENAPMTPAECRQVEPVVTGTSMWRVTARMRGPSHRWGAFLMAVARGPAYLTLTRFEILGGEPQEARIDWTWHTLPPHRELSVGRRDLIDWEGDVLEQRLPNVSGREKRGSGKNRGG